MRCLKALILAAGYGERLLRSLRDYEGPHLTNLMDWIGDKPKGLVSVNAYGDLAPLLYHHIALLKKADIDLNNIYIHTNDTFHQQYLRHALKLGLPERNVINNNIKRKEDRKGPLGDLRLALDSVIGYDEPMLVLSSDTLTFNKDGLFDLNLLIKGYYEDGLSRIVVYEGQPHRLRNHGLVQANENKIMVGFQEKPQFPEEIKSNLINASVHLYSRSFLKEIPKLHDQIGFNEKINVLQFLYTKHQVKVEKAFSRLDIGTIADVLRVNLGLEN